MSRSPGTGQTDMFTMADSEASGNLAFREWEGYEQDGRASNEYTYNGLLFFWGSDKFLRWSHETISKPAGRVLGVRTYGAVHMDWTPPLTAYQKAYPSGKPA